MRRYCQQLRGVILCKQTISRRYGAMVLFSFLNCFLTRTVGALLAAMILLTSAGIASAKHRYGHAKPVVEPRSALCAALSANNMQEANRLWRESADVYQHGKHASLTACASQPQQLNWLLQRGFAISRVPGYVIQKLLEEKRNSVFSRYMQLIPLDPAGHQDLMLHAPDLSTIKLLHQKGIPVDFPGNGADPLMAAIPTPAKRGVCEEGDYVKHEDWGNGGAEVVAYLCQNGATIEREHDSCNQGTLARAVQYGDSAIIDALIDHCKVPANGVIRDVEQRRRGPLQLMMHAVDNRQPKLIHHLHQRGAKLDIASNDWRNTTPLITAVLNGDKDSVAALLELGADPNYLPRSTYTQKSLASDGVEYFVAQTALIYAVKKHPELVPLLLDAGADPGQRFGDGETALSVAIAQQNWSLADRLYNARKESANSGAMARELANERLISGVKNRNPAMVKQALELGVSYEVLNNAMALVGDPDSARQLLAAGASPHPKDNDALEKLFDDENWATASVLLKAGADPLQIGDQYQLLAKIASPNHIGIDLLKAALDSGLNPNLIHKHYRSPFSSLVSGGREDAIELMLAAGADPNLRPPAYERRYWGNKLGWKDYSLELEIEQSDARSSSPLMSAIQRASYSDSEENHRRIVLQLLRAHGKKMGLLRIPRLDEVRDEAGRTLTMQTLSYREGNYKKKFPLVKLLLDLGVNQHARDNLGRTALIHLAMSDLGWASGSYHYYGEPNTPAFNEFIRRGADAKISDALGRNALHYLSYRITAPRSIALLATHGADINQADKNGVTPLMFAAANQGGEEVVQQLLDLGADPNRQDKNGWTALQWAFREHMRRPYAEEKNIALLAPVTNLALKDIRGTRLRNKLRAQGYSNILKSLGPNH